MTAKEKIDQQFRDHVALEMRTCKHFNGTVINGACRAGVNYHALLGEGVGCFKHMPCLGDPKSPVVCSLVQFPTREEAEATTREDEAVVNRFCIAMPAVKKHARAAGLGVGNGGRGEMPCPAGCGGTLRYSISGNNAHTVAACSTEGCLSWME